MGFTFRKRIAIVPGLLFWTINSRSHSLTLKLGPFSRTWNSKGRRTISADIPGPLGWRHTTTARSRREHDYY